MCRTHRVREALWGCVAGRMCECVGRLWKTNSGGRLTTTIRLTGLVQGVFPGGWRCTIEGKKIKKNDCKLLHGSRIADTPKWRILIQKPIKFVVPNWCHNFEPSPSVKGIKWWDTFIQLISSLLVFEVPLMQLALKSDASLDSAYLNNKPSKCWSMPWWFFRREIGGFLQRNPGSPEAKDVWMLKLICLFCWVST